MSDGTPLPNRDNSAIRPAFSGVMTGSPVGSGGNTRVGVRVGEEVGHGVWVRVKEGVPVKEREAVGETSATAEPSVDGIGEHADTIESAAMGKKMRGWM